MSKNPINRAPPSIKFFATIVTIVVIFLPTKSNAFYYFGGKVTAWQDDAHCPYIEVANKGLDALCASSGICLTLKYGKLTYTAVENKNSTPNIDRKEHIEKQNLGLFSVTIKGVKQGIPFYGNYQNFNPTKIGGYVLGQAVDVSLSCNPCTNDLLKSVINKAGVNIEPLCKQEAIRKAIDVATIGCKLIDTTIAKACPTKVVCYNGSSASGKFNPLNLLSVDLCKPFE